MTHAKYAPLFQIYTLNNGIEIKNRLVVAPMTHWARHLIRCRAHLYR
ncbi:2,4-dienoyl-CoA reductase-like NADH-dependent reductase (Old Yellow Enzyme family) [Neisseria perflava]|nr:2,4-dienoyl-CoA reductase-like NADH-dependent reductase (Old Yellow Enzyme family) [Neisseria perflava]